MSATAASPETAAQLLFPPNVQYNNSRLYTVKFLSCCFAGAVAGVLGLENMLGFALFVFSTMLTSSCLYVKCKGRPAKYVSGGWSELVNPGQENIFSFVLMWTLFYGIVHGTFATCDGVISQISMEPCSQSTIEDGRRTPSFRVHLSHSDGPSKGLIGTGLKVGSGGWVDLISSMATVHLGYEERTREWTVSDALVG